MAKRIKLPGRVESAEVGGIVTGANAIMDDEKGKVQSQINSETDAELLRLQNEKQDNITVDGAPTEGSNNPVASGGVYTAEKALSDAIEAILLLIPSAATALNKLADREFVASSIATSTANFKGTFNLVSDLHLSVDATHEEIAQALDALGLDADANDYCFVQVPESDMSEDIKVTQRYKFNGTLWAYEYDLNNSGFTAEQWAAINSNITALLVAKLVALPTAEVLAGLLGGKQDSLTFDEEPTAGSNNPVKSGGVFQANNEIIALINALEQAKQDVLTFDQSPVQGSSNPVTSGGVYDAIYLVQTVLATLGGNVETLQYSVSLLTEQVGILNTLYQALTQSDIIVGALPGTGVANRVYRVPGTSTYSDWMWYDGAWVKLAEYTTLDGYMYKGIATPNGSPAASAVKMFYFALTPGTYTNFGNLVVKYGINILKYDGANWTLENLGNSDGVFDVTEYSGSSFASLEALLSDENLSNLIPVGVRKGGMSIKFVCSSDNKYVQFRLMSDSFNTTVSNWQGIDDVPTAGSENLVQSGGVYKNICRNLPGLLKWTKIKAIINTENKWAVGDNFKSVLIPVDGGSNYLIKGGGTGINSIVAFLKDANHVNGSLVNYATGSSRTVLSGINEISGTVPIDAAYLFVTVEVNDSSWLPSEVIMDGYDFVKGINDTLKDISERIDETNTRIDNTNIKFFNNSFVGKDNYYSETKVNGLLPGHTYRIYLDGTEWLYPQSEYRIFGVISYYNNETPIYMVDIFAGTSLKSTYDFTVPEQSDYVIVGGRASSGIVVRFDIIDITDLILSSSMDDTPMIGSTKPVRSNGVAMSEHLLEQKILPLSKWAYNGRFYISNDKYVYANNFNNGFLFIDEGSQYSITAGSDGPALIAFLTSYNPVNGDAVPFVSGTSVISIAQNQTVTGVVPNGAKFMWVWYGQTFNRIPTKLIINGYDYISGAYITPDAVIEVNLSDYTNLRDCLESISPSKDTSYIVNIQEGEYDIKSCFTAEEIAENGFKGLFVPDYVTLRGIGRKEYIVLKWYNDDNDRSELISVLNLRNSAGLENMTVNGQNIRYAIHDDFAERGMIDRKRCFNIDVNIYKGVYNAAWGAGQKGDQIAEFECCNFYSDKNNKAFSSHNNTDVARPSYIRFKNCTFTNGTQQEPATFEAFGLSSLNNNTVSLTYVSLENCTIQNGIRMIEENVASYGAGIKYQINGFGNNIKNSDVHIYNTDGVDYTDRIQLTKYVIDNS